MSHRLSPGGAKERGISFSVPMVQALLDGRKTQTRRTMKPQPALAFDDSNPKRRSYEWKDGMFALECYPADSLILKHCPYGKPGDLLWVREPWQAWTEFNGLPPSEIPENRASILFTADRPDFPWDSRKRQARFMCRWMSRITLKVTEVRVQRLQDIDYRDTAAEGYPFNGHRFNNFDEEKAAVRQWYRALWEQINGPGSWDQNPWLWCVTFEVVEVKK